MATTTPGGRAIPRPTSWTPPKGPHGPAGTPLGKEENCGNNGTQGPNSKG